MSVKVKEFYNNINQLLEDICTFLSDEKNFAKLPATAKKQAENLIKRSKIQLEDIQKFTENPENDGAYMDMDGKQDVIVDIVEGDDQNNIYSAVTETPSKQPYEEIKTSEQINKGYLYWRVKFILNFEKLKRIYCVIDNYHLLIYPNEKIKKPTRIFDLDQYEAVPVECKSNKLPQDFELININEKKDRFYFSTPSNDIMSQWISQINSKWNIKDNNYIAIVDSKKVDYENPDEIYHEVLTDRGVEDGNQTFEQPPDLPSRLPHLMVNNRRYQIEIDDELYETFTSVEPTLTNSTLSMANQRNKEFFD